MTTSKSDDIQLLNLLRSNCPVSGALDILGDKWTLIVVRDLLLDKKTYGDLQQGPEGIPTNILADRLKKLQAFGIIEKSLYQEKPKRYEYRLSKKGLDLAPLIIELVRWGSKYIAGTRVNDSVKPYL